MKKIAIAILLIQVLLVCLRVIYKFSENSLGIFEAALLLNIMFIFSFAIIVLAKSEKVFFKRVHKLPYFRKIVFSLMFLNFFYFCISLR